MGNQILRIWWFEPTKFQLETRVTIWVYFSLHEKTFNRNSKRKALCMWQYYYVPSISGWWHNVDGKIVAATCWWSFFSCCSFSYSYVQNKMHKICFNPSEFNGYSLHQGPRGREISPPPQKCCIHIKRMLFVYVVKFCNIWSSFFDQNDTTSSELAHY